MQAKAREIISLDLGLKCTGIARASSASRLPEPLLTVATDKVAETIKALTESKDVEAIVVGLPRNLNGEDTDHTRWVREWINSAKSSIPAAFYWQDETLSSKTAQALKLKTKSPADEHALAAAIILQDFLNTPEIERTLA